MYTPLRGLLALLLFLSLPSAHALELGDGSDDANCTWSNGDTIEIRLWQCVNLNISGTITFVDSSNDDAGVDILDIRVQQTATVDGVMNLSPDGPNGGFGGYTGGAGQSADDGLPGGGPGPLDSEGKGGLVGDTSGFSNCSGSGASGGRHSGLNPPSPGEATVTISGCTPTDVNGAAAPTENSSDPTSLRGEIRGGPGGGAGGGATGSPSPGGNGGDGGGVIRVLVGETLDLGASADLNVNGGNGDPGSGAGDAQSGGGGGGAGGIIYLASLKDINITTGASLQASGGNGGTATSPGGSGSSGDSGIIRLEDDDGVINGAGAASTPSASVSTVSEVTSSSQTILSSDISPGCAFREYDENVLSLAPILLAALALTLILGQGVVRACKINRPSL